MLLPLSQNMKVKISYIGNHKDYFTPYFQNRVDFYFSLPSLIVSLYGLFTVLQKFPLVGSTLFFSFFT